LHSEKNVTEITDRRNRATAASSPNSSADSGDAPSREYIVKNEVRRITVNFAKLLGAIEEGVIPASE
jgi:hypothetical protein